MCIWSVCVPPWTRDLGGLPAPSPSDAGKQRTGAGMWPGGEGTQGRRAGEEHGRRAMEGEGLGRAVLDGRLSLTPPASSPPPSWSRRLPCSSRMREVGSPAAPGGDVASTTGKERRGASRPTTGSSRGPGGTPVGNEEPEKGCPSSSSPVRVRNTPWFRWRWSRRRRPRIPTGFAREPFLSVTGGVRPHRARRTVAALSPGTSQRAARPSLVPSRSICSPSASRVMPEAGLAASIVGEEKHAVGGVGKPASPRQVEGAPADPGGRGALWLVGNERVVWGLRYGCG